MKVQITRNGTNFVIKNLEKNKILSGIYYKAHQSKVFLAGEFFFDHSWNFHGKLICHKIIFYKIINTKLNEFEEIETLEFFTGNEIKEKSFIAEL